MNKTSTITLTIPAPRIYFIGATASNKLKVSMVGSTIATNAHTYSIAPSPTAKPPNVPTIRSVAEINPNRLNSVFSPNILSEPFVSTAVPIILTFTFITKLKHFQSEKNDLLWLKT